MHFKAVIVDGAFVYVGSANWTGAGLGAKGAGRRNFELGFAGADDGLLDRVQELYDRVWRGAACKGCKLRDLCPSPLDGKPLGHSAVAGLARTHGRVYVPCEMAMRMRGDDDDGIIALVKETASGFGQLVGDHIRLARIEMTADAKSYARDVGMLVDRRRSSSPSATGWPASPAALALARIMGGPLAFACLALLHVLVGGIALAGDGAQDEAPAAHAGDQARGQPQRERARPAATYARSHCHGRALRERAASRETDGRGRGWSRTTTRAGRSRFRRWRARRPPWNDRASASNVR